jgi:hypothetical protein
MIKLTTASLLAALFALPALAAPAPQSDTADNPAVKTDDGLRNPTNADRTKPDDAASLGTTGNRAASGPDDGLRNPANRTKPDDGLHTTDNSKR